MLVVDHIFKSRMYSLLNTSPVQKLIRTPAVAKVNFNGIHVFLFAFNQNIYQCTDTLYFCTKN